MKYSDIPKLTSWGNYMVDSELKYFLEHIKEMEDELELSPLQLCPDFQRGHVWTEAQQVSFIEFILKGGRCQPILFNHPGWQDSYKGEFVLVDGLQRITALRKFFNNEIQAFSCFYDDFEDKRLINRITLTYYINNLKTRREVLKWYIELNSGGTPHTAEELKRVKHLLILEKQ